VAALPAAMSSIVIFGGSPVKLSVSTVVVRTLSGIMPLMLTAFGAATAEPPQKPIAAVASLGPPGLPASTFPKPDRPVVQIGAPDWSTEEARDRDGEAEQVMRFCSRVGV
jgi:hypothetical protein